MSYSLSSDGFEIRRGVIEEAQISDLRAEAERVASGAGTVCVRSLCAKSELFDALAISPALLSLLPAGMMPVRSILFDKTPAENWPVLWHQDLTIAVSETKEVAGYGPWSVKDGVPHVQPPAQILEGMMTIRLHLDDTPAGNGALRVIPGSHLSGKLKSRQVTELRKEPEVVCECKAGDVLLLSPLILHSSKRSDSPQRRRILHFEYARLEELNSNLQWHEAIRKSE